MNGIKLNLLVIMLLSTFNYAQTIYAKFPGRRASLLSPNHRYVLRNVDQSGEPYHSILLADRKTGKARKVYDYGRHATVIWAPDSRHFAINDYAGSDFARTYIVSVDSAAPVIDVRQEIQNKAGGFKTPTEADHEYFGVARWMDARWVKVFAWGHGGNGEFCRCYEYLLGAGVAECATQPASAELERQCWKLTP